MPVYSLLVGTYTRSEPHAPQAQGEGIHWMTFRDGDLSPGDVAARVVNPSFVALHPQGHTVYAVSEVEHGSVHSFRIAAPGEALEPLGIHSTQGESPAHVSVNPAGDALFAVNYSSGASVLAYTLESSGLPVGTPRSAAHRGQGPNAARQEAPHAHCARPSPDGQHLYVVDLGTDEVVAYGAGSLEHLHTLALPPGSGPRHLSFSPDGTVGFLSLELSSELAVVRRDPASGTLALLQIHRTFLGTGRGPNLTAEVLVSPCGRFAYVSNRGRDTVTVFHWDGERAEAALLAEMPSLGRTPRSMVFAPGATHLLIGNQDSSSVTVYARDAVTGGLDSPRTVRCPTPTSLCFLPDPS
ncbi:lactonase family protein [Deinococcus hopiensis]|nr:lactonase family protein [Deinococcus hopiensis]